LATALTVLLLTEVGQAQIVEEKPLVELGVFGVGGTFPDYPASAQNHFHALPLPYIIYRGEYFQLAPNSVRGIIVNTDRMSFDVSASGAFNSSHNDVARKGMPGLDDMGQIGPRFNFLLTHDAGYAKIDIELPVRAVFSTDFKSVAYRGVVAAPELAYTHADFMGWGGRLKFGFGPEFASARLMDYFYAVAPQFVVPGRPQYNATGGYLGSRAELSYRYPIGSRASIIGLVAPELYSGAANESSPLFKKQFGMSAALAFSYSLYGSDAKARAAGETDADAEPYSSPKAFTADEPPSPFVSAASSNGSAAHAERRADTKLEPISSPQPLVAEVHPDDAPPASVHAPDPLVGAAMPTTFHESRKARRIPWRRPIALTIVPRSRHTAAIPLRPRFRRRRARFPTRRICPGGSTGYSPG
jgi:outer membrane scaffolding protein for murein synthesis (MipA/OmpV family)